MSETSLPRSVRQDLSWTLGPIGAVERLGGISGGQVYRVQTPAGGAILKGRARLVEVRCYRELAPKLRAAGVGMPELIWSGRSGADCWLALELIPRPLPPERRLADPAVLGTLGRLHTSGLQPPLDAPDAYRPAWPASMSDAALSLLPRSEADALAPIVGELRRRYQRLFEPRCIISCDPNPLNWGLREDRTVVLFDWERISLGTPALDLAITVPGLGDPAAFRRVAEGYLPGASSMREQDELARDIAAAKTWSLLEFLSNAARFDLGDGGHLGETSRWLAAQFPDWLRSMRGTWSM